MSRPFTEAEFALHRYFIAANRMRTHFLQSGLPPTERHERRFWMQIVQPYVTIWVSLLHVLIEGWRQLELQDEAIQPLLESRNVELLRRFRNGTFHFQPIYFDRRFTEFLLEGDGGLEWAGTLHRAFDDWFRRRIAETGIEIPEMPEDDEQS